MSRRRKFVFMTAPPVAKYIRAAQRSIADASTAIQKGDCREAVHSLAHARQMAGLAEGYARAMREVKGRPTSMLKLETDKRLAGLARLQVRVANTCARKS